MDIKNNKPQIHHTKADPWIVTVIDTGEDSMTGGRCFVLQNIYTMKKLLLLWRWSWRYKYIRTIDPQITR